MQSALDPGVLKAFDEIKGVEAGDGGSPTGDVTMTANARTPTHASPE